MDNDQANRLAAMEARWDAIIPTLATKADIEALRAEMHKMAAEAHKWMVGSLIGLFIGFCGVAIALGQVVRQATAPLAQGGTPAGFGGPAQPIVIYLTPPQQPTQPKK